MSNNRLVHAPSPLAPRPWSDDLIKDYPRPDPDEILLVVRKGDYELKLTRRGYEKVNKVQFNRVLSSLFPKKSKKGSVKNARRSKRKQPDSL